MEKEKAIFFGNAGNIGRVYCDSVRSRLAEHLDIEPHVYTLRELSEMDFARDRAASAQYIFSSWGMPSLTVEQIREYFPALRAVFYAAGSVQGFAREFIGCGIAVFSAWGANAVPVAQFTSAEILLALKGWFPRVYNGVGEYEDAARMSRWHNRGGVGYYPGIMDEKVGIIGAGMIGRLVIEQLRSYPIEILVYDKFLSADKIAALGGKKAELSEIFSECFVISNHLANNAETTGLLDYSCFSKMRDNAVFINTGRGAQLKEADLIRALRENETRIALLDVTDPFEPPVPSSPLYYMKNVFLTPHIAGSIGNEVRRMAEYMYDEYLAFSQGKPVLYRITEEMLMTMA